MTTSPFPSPRPVEPPRAPSPPNEPLQAPLAPPDLPKPGESIGQGNPVLEDSPPEDQSDG